MRTAAFLRHFDLKFTWGANPGANCSVCAALQPQVRGGRVGLSIRRLPFGFVTELATIAPAFVEMAHRIVWCTVATTGADGRPSTRILHPIWEWDGAGLTGWIATSPNSPKAGDLAVQPHISLTYWDPTHDTATADCLTVWDTTDEERRAGWDRFAKGPAPVGYDPSIIPQWPDPTAPEFGILRLLPIRLRVMPGSYMLKGEGELLTWRAA